MEPIKKKSVILKGKMNNRQKMLVSITVSLLFLGLVVILNFALSESRLAMDFTSQKMPPSLKNLFGTDWLGRDMFTRTFKGLHLSIRVGLISSCISVLAALVLGIMSATLGRYVDAAISWLVDMFLGMPHMVLMILISFAIGGGTRGVIIAVAVTHWPSLTRVIRAEVLQIRTSHYVQASANMGKSRLWIAFQHILPHLLPQLFVGFVLLFPHAVLHEASLTFLGFGLSPLKPAIGVILSEALQYLSTGMWWLAFFPGLALLLVVRCFDSIGNSLNRLLDPYTSQE
mgnify:CR=1 FL=1